MKVTIHQPEHMPWLGYFDKMAKADIYVILDIVQYRKNYFQNRNKFIDPRTGDVYWLTVPVLLKGHTSLTIKDMQINNSQNWKRKYWAKLQDSYRKHPHFHPYSEEVYSILTEDWEYLAKLNLALIEFFRKHLNINNKLIRASELDIDGKQSELLLDICKKTKASVYLAGPSGRDYLDKNIFEKSGIDVEFHAFEHPVYPSVRFAPYLSTLDLLMNCGEKSANILGICE